MSNAPGFGRVYSLTSKVETMTTVNATGWTKQEILDKLSDPDPDDVGYLCDALDWLASETGTEIDDGEYSESSILYAVEDENPELLEHV